ncbi:hypothetical protein BDV23DRAFT_147663 [Aspergillus alliaceus]|uniref:Uncharacterized protein n=1 Tax=Petromyces alliaceus TaxID=209559 RepID=A0A5N7CKB3_PETAA|nr:hypothetical protein BDV23DRAFT_147663 [Aspergillus alliaceus]
MSNLFLGRYLERIRIILAGILIDSGNPILPRFAFLFVFALAFLICTGSGSKGPFKLPKSY